jgi:cytochrome c oxidase subunit 1
VLGALTLPFIWNVVKSYRYGRIVTVDGPWGFGYSLEWATSCPRRHNFTELPRIRSERPAFELHYPHLVDRFHNEAHAGDKPSPYEIAAQSTGAGQQPDDEPKSPEAPFHSRSGGSAARSLVPQP